MSDSIPQKLILDDERFDKLVDTIEVLLDLFVRETVADDEGDLVDEDVEAEVEVGLGYLAVVLTALNAQIVSNSKSRDNEETDEIKLTVPNGDLLEVVRRVIEEFRSDEFD
jgi:hypothetical protein